MLRQITDELMFEIRELTGQEYRDVYATKKSESIPSEAARVAHVDDPVRDGAAGAGRRRADRPDRPCPNRPGGGTAAGRFAGAMSDILVTLPDGSERAYPDGVDRGRRRRVHRLAAGQGSGGGHRGGGGVGPGRARCRSGRPSPSSPTTPTRVATSCGTRPPTSWPRPSRSSTPGPSSRSARPSRTASTTTSICRTAAPSTRRTWSAIEARMREIIAADQPFDARRGRAGRRARAVRRPALQGEIIERVQDDDGAGVDTVERRGHGRLDHQRVPQHAPSSSTCAAVRTSPAPGGSVTSSS